MQGEEGSTEGKAENGAGRRRTLPLEGCGAQPGRGINANIRCDVSPCPTAPPHLPPHPVDPRRVPGQPTPGAVNSSLLCQLVTVIMIILMIIIMITMIMITIMIIIIIIIIIMMIPGQPTPGAFNSSLLCQQVTVIMMMIITNIK
jgi:hypothetical protein